MTYEIVIARDTGARAWLSSNSLSTDALQGLKSIPGVTNPELVEESELAVRLRYGWLGSVKFWQTDECLKRFGVLRADWPAR